MRKVIAELDDIISRAVEENARHEIRRKYPILPDLEDSNNHSALPTTNGTRDWANVPLLTVSVDVDRPR